MVGETSRKNSRLSTGPKSALGKETVRENATKHGIFSSNPALIAGEDSVKFDSILQNLIDEYQPEGILELHYINQIAMFSMRQYRIFAYEAALANLDCIEIPPDKFPQFKQQDNLDFSEPTEFNVELLNDEKRRLIWLLKYIDDLKGLPGKRSKDFQESYEEVSQPILEEIEQLFKQPYSSYSQIKYPHGLASESRDKQMEILKRLHQERTRIDREKEQQSSDYYWLKLESKRLSLRCGYHLELRDFKELIEVVNLRINNIERLIIEINHHHSERELKIKEREKALKALSYIDCDRIHLVSRYEAHNNRQLKQAIEQLEARIQARKNDKI